MRSYKLCMMVASIELYSSIPVAMTDPISWSHWYQKGKTGNGYLVTISYPIEFRFSMIDTYMDVITKTVF